MFEPGAPPPPRRRSAQGLPGKVLRLSRATALPRGESVTTLVTEWRHRCVSFVQFVYNTDIIFYYNSGKFSLLLKCYINFISLVYA